jgi:hypothetical protein
MLLMGGQPRPCISLNGLQVKTAISIIPDNKEIE